MNWVGCNFKLLLGLGLLSATVRATPLINSTGISGATGQITFQELALTQGDLITNQYAGLGATFSGQGLFFQTLNTGGLLPNHLFDGPTEPTATPAPGTAISFLIQFAGTVSAASVQLLFAAPGITDTTQLTMTALAGGITQETFPVINPDLNNFSNNFYGFTGLSFDAIRVDVNYTGAPTTRPGVGLDNVAFAAVAPSGAPELGGTAYLPLFSAGMLLMLSRRRAKGK